MKTHFPFGGLVSALLMVVAPACVISATDSGDDEDDTGAGSSSGASEDDSAPSNTDPTAGDESPSDAEESSGGEDPTAGALGPEDGPWTYADAGASQNDCAFFDATQGVGDFVVQNHGDGTFTIIPGDETDPFECQMGDGGAFSCPSRFVDSIDEAGVDAVLEAWVMVEGTTTATEMQGDQLGEISCEGSDCATAEALLQTSLPCTFVIPFTASR